MIHFELDLLPAVVLRAWALIHKHCTARCLGWHALIDSGLASKPDSAMLTHDASADNVVISNPWKWTNAEMYDFEGLSDFVKDHKIPSPQVQS